VSGPLRGVSGAPGAAVGPAWRLDAATTRMAGRADEERERVRSALAATAEQLEQAARALAGQGKEAEAEIVDSNALMAADPTLLDAALGAVAEGVTAEAAIAEAVEQQAALLESLDDPTLALRAADVRQIARQAARLAAGEGAGTAPEGAVVVGDDIGPAEVAEAHARIAGIALAGGGATAHASIVARSLGVPLVAQLGDALRGVVAGTLLAVDGDAGTILVDPDEATAASIAERARELARRRALDAAERDLPAATQDGRRLRLYANAGTAEEVRAALAAGAEGIGLLRSEMAFLDVAAWPDEAAHRAALAPLLEPLAGRVATVRTLDFGGDKTPPFLLRPGQDPFLAPRGIRLALTAPEALEAQLRALYAVAGEAQVRILVPMVSEPDELDAVRELAERARLAVAPDREPYGVGAMIEVPAAALLGERLARHADFFSVGTNDLVQYTLATARLGDETPFARADHPAVLRLIALAADAAHAAGIPIEVCGEAAGDPAVLPLLVGLGVDELSVSPARIGETRRQVRALTLDDAQRRARAATAA
jgi:phosphoenolpyruvate-protein phosphotransferase